MKTSMIASLQAFIVYRPPLVAFSISLLAITATIFVVAVYVKDGKFILDSRAHEDWTSLLNFLNKQTFCISAAASHLHSESTSEIHAKSMALTHQNSTFLTAKFVSSIQTKWLQSLDSGNSAMISGIISLKGLQTSCHQLKNIYPMDENVDISIIIPASSVKSDQNVPSCVYLTGSFPLLSALDSADRSKKLLSEKCNAQLAPLKAIGQISSFLKENSEKGNASRCHPENEFQLLFEGTGFEPKIYLKEEDKLQIASHLFIVGYFLLGLFTCILFIACFQGKKFVLEGQLILLPTKETV